MYGADCETTDECAFENAECVVEVVDETKKCRCSEDFVGIGDTCFEKGKTLENVRRVEMKPNKTFQLKAITTLAQTMNNARLCLVRRLLATTTNAIALNRFT